MNNYIYAVFYIIPKSTQMYIGELEGNIYTSDDPYQRTSISESNVPSRLVLDTHLYPFFTLYIFYNNINSTIDTRFS